MYYAEDEFSYPDEEIKSSLSLNGFAEWWLDEVEVLGVSRE